MTITKIDIRQSETRILQDQLNSASNIPMDSVLASINNELTSPGRLIAATTPSLVVTVGSGIVVNPNTNKNRVLPAINSMITSFTGGTVTFPSTSGTITVSPGTNSTITIGANQFVAVLVQLNSSSQLSLTVGSAASSLPTVVVPSGIPSNLSLGYIIVQSNGSSVIQNVTNSMLYQFVGGGGSGSGSGSGSKNYMSAVTTSQSTTPNVGNGNFELGNTTGWSLANSTLNSENLMPNQASGSWTAAAGALSLVAITGANVLSGTYSGRVISSNQTTAGDMLVSDPFFIDESDQNSVLGVGLSFQVPAGSTNGNFSGTINNSFSVAVYDVTNATWIQVYGNYGLILESGATKFTGAFQTSATGTQYRLALYNMNATAQYIFELSSTPGTITTGTTYTNNGQTFTVVNVYSSGGNNFVAAQGTGAPSASGTLTLGAGSGPATITYGSFVTGPNASIEYIVDDFFVGPQVTSGSGGAYKAPTVQVFTAGSGTYSLPTGPTPSYIRVTVVAGGAGGDGSGGSPTNGGTGVASTFGTSLLVANPGLPAANANTGGVGGTASVSSPAISILTVQGGDGAGTPVDAVAGFAPSGVAGGSNPLGGGGAFVIGGGNGAAAKANTGGGGGGGAASSGGLPAAGGGAGGYLVAIIQNPATSYSYAVGAGGAGGANGGQAQGGAGAAGIIIVEEFYSPVAETNSSSGASKGPTVQTFTSGSGTYSLPTGPTPSYIEIEMVGAGGGGSGSGTGSAGSANPGGDTTFGTGTAHGGLGAGYTGSIGGAGGAASLGSGWIGTATPGTYGGGAAYSNASVTQMCGSSGGGNTYCGAGGPGGGGGNSALGASAAGQGGGGAGIDAATNNFTGGGGGGGGYIRAIIPNPASSYSFSIGTGGIGGTAGTSGHQGGQGGAGIIIVREYYGTPAPMPTIPVRKAPTVQTFTAGSGTYSLPTGPIPLYIRVRMVGGGGNGGNVNSGGSGTTGASTTFGTSLLTAAGGQGGGSGSSEAGIGGGFTVNSPAIDNGSSFGGGGGGSLNVTSGGGGGVGGNSALGGGAPSSNWSSGATSAPGYGGGGSGAAVPGSPGTGTTGAGGGGGGFVDAFIYNPATSYPYSVAALVSGGSSNGGIGVIIVTEYYQ